MARENRFASVSSKGVSLGDITKDVNEARSHSVTAPLKTEKVVEDIDIDLIDEYELNDTIFGYNNLDALKNSIDKTDDAIIVTVYKRANGRYLCWDGNSRLKVLKNMGVKKVTCNISGPEPESEHEKLVNAICANTQRIFDPYHIAHEIQEVENSFRKEKGLTGELLTSAVADLTGYGVTSQKYYKQILKLNPDLQVLFNSESVPFKSMLAMCKKVPADKAKEFAYAYCRLKEEREESSELIEQAFAYIMNESDNKRTISAPAISFGKEYREICNLKRDKSGNYYIPDSKKSDYLKQVERMENELQKIKAACL